LTACVSKKKEEKLLSSRWVWAKRASRFVGIPGKRKKGGGGGGGVGNVGEEKKRVSLKR